MCDNCSNIENIEVSEHDIAVMALSIVGGLIENYCENNYCDPTMYNALEIAEKLAMKLGEIGLAERITTVKMYAGETINTIIDDNNLPISKESWS
jgi:hypothetical protein